MSNVSSTKKDRRKEEQPLKLLLLSFVYSAAICTLHIVFGQTSADLCFNMNETSFPLCTSGRAVWKVCSGLYILTFQWSITNDVSSLSAVQQL